MKTLTLTGNCIVLTPASLAFSSFVIFEKRSFVSAFHCFWRRFTFSAIDPSSAGETAQRSSETKMPYDRI